MGAEGIHKNLADHLKGHAPVEATLELAKSLAEVARLTSPKVSAWSQQLNEVRRNRGPVQWSGGHADGRNAHALIIRVVTDVLQAIHRAEATPEGLAAVQLPDTSQLVEEIALEASAVAKDEGRRQKSPNIKRPVVLGTTWKERVHVNGNPKKLSAPGQFQIIKALVDAGADGLDKDDLESVNSGARRILRKLRKTDGDWAAVIQMGEKKGGRYRLVNPSQPS